jgi:hypothetical protein
MLAIGRPFLDREYGKPPIDRERPVDPPNGPVWVPKIDGARRSDDNSGRRRILGVLQTSCC